MANLITPYEVLVHSSAGKNYPTAEFCDLIPQIEEEFVRVCLGSELYEFLLANLATVPSALEWDATATYALDDAVIRNGCIFLSLAGGNTGNDPLLDAVNWSAFERFSHAGSLELWEKYLRRILALKVYSASLTLTTWRSGAGGIVVNGGDAQGFRSAGKAEISEIKTGILAEVERTTGNMVAWLTQNATTKGLPYATACLACPTPGRASRRWGFKY